MAESLQVDFVFKEEPFSLSLEKICVAVYVEERPNCPKETLDHKSPPQTKQSVHFNLQNSK